MLYLDEKTGKVFESIEHAWFEYCVGRSCHDGSCDMAKQSGDCMGFVKDNPIKAAEIMGYETIRMPGVDFPESEYRPEGFTFVKKYNVERDHHPKYEGHYLRHKPAPVTPEERIKRILDKADIASQLAEESNELAQAAWKLHRLEGGKNPVRKTGTEIMENLIEEIADVSLCLKLLGMNTGLIRMKVFCVMQEKAKRWADDLERGSGAHL